MRALRGWSRAIDTARLLAKGKASAAEPEEEPESQLQINMLNANGQAPIHCAAQRGDRGIMTVVVDGGAHRGRGPSTLLTWTTGADVNMRNRDGETALHIAAYAGHESCVRHLLDCDGARPPARRRRTLIHTSSWQPILRPPIRTVGQHCTMP